MTLLGLSFDEDLSLFDEEDDFPFDLDELSFLSRFVEDDAMLSCKTLREDAADPLGHVPVQRDKAYR